MVVTIANADISVATKTPPNGKQKYSLAILPKYSAFANNPKVTFSYKINSNNCTRHHCKCSFSLLPQEEHAACQENTELLEDPETELDTDFQQNCTELPSLSQQILAVLCPEELGLIRFISTIRPRTHNVGNFDIWKSQIPL